jgi:putative transcriptional regulator
MRATLAALALVGAAAGIRAQPAVPVRGSVLIATDRTHDPAFSETVILVLQHDRNRSAGVVLNRPLGESMAALFPELAKSSCANHPLWAGGPVAIGINALASGRSPLPGGSALVPGVWVVADRGHIRDLVAGGGRQIRVYVGLCNWGPGQLDDEIGRGLWRVSTASADLIFDAHTDTLWRRLVGH